MSEVPTAPETVPSVLLLGPPELRGPQGGQPLRSERPHLLLAYLAARQTWVARDELADWLYPGRDLEAARSNLRKVIFLARKLASDTAVEQRGDLLRWAPSTDLQRFEAACNARRWAEAVAAYRGPLLQGLESAWPAGGVDWLDSERQRLQSRWQEACARRLAELADDPQATRALAEAMLRHDPLDDTAIEALGRAQQALGQREAALATLADYSRRLREQVGLPRSAALDALDAELRRAAPAAPLPAPAPPTGLVGRRHERGQVRERLARPECRVLTLLGPPGVGKSTLLRALQAELGGHWIALESLVHAAEVPERIAAALDLALDTTLPPWSALGRALAPRAELLLLDNAEHLGLADELAALLEAAPRLRLLAASRAPLGLAGEWRLPLEGLPLPDRDETDPEVLAANDAVRLFAERAHPVAPAFSLAAEAGDVVRLVHEVDGLPLAIELLAAWRRLMPVADILAELAESLDLLEPSHPSERSVRASFARSWRQLGPLEQRVLAQLAQLPAPIDRDLVRGALQAPLPVLASLVDRSLLQADGQGRFSLHPLIRRLAAPLAGDGDALHERHARHIARRLAGTAERGDEFLAHLRAAWRWALQRGDAALLDALHEPYTKLLQRLVLWREGTQAMDDMLQVLQARPTAEDGLAQAQALSIRAGFAYQGGALDEALRDAQAAEALAQRAGDLALAAYAASRIGAVCWQRGDHAAARTAFQRQFELGSGLPDAALRQAKAQAWLALVDKAEGKFDAALRSYERALALVREAGALPSHLYLLNNLGNLLRLLRRETEALDRLKEGLQLARQHGQREDEPFLLTNIALVHAQRGQHDTAVAWAGRAVAAAAEHGEPMIDASARVMRATSLAALTGRAAPAMEDIWAALAIAESLQSPPAQLEALIGAGWVLVHAGDRDHGVALVRWALGRPECSAAERMAALDQLDRLGLGVAASATPLPAEAGVEAALALLRHATLA